MSNEIKTEIEFLNASKYRVYGRVISTSRAGDKHIFDICTKKDKLLCNQTNNNFTGELELNNTVIRISLYGRLKGVSFLYK